MKNRKNNTRPLNHQNSRAAFDTVRRPLTRTATKRWFESRAFYKRPLLSQLHSKQLRQQRRIVRRKNVVSRFGHVLGRVLQQPARALDKDCRREWRKILSWRADQKGSGKGGRTRAERSQREKVASAAKHLKDC